MQVVKPATVVGGKANGGEARGVSMTAVLVCLAALGLAGHAAAQTNADRLYQQAVAQYNAGDYRGAIKNAEAAAQADPQHWQAWQVDGNARYALGDKQGALTVYQYSLRINPNNPQLKSFVDQLSGALQPTQAAKPATPTAVAASAAGKVSGVTGKGIKVGLNLATLTGKGADPDPGESKKSRMGFAVGGFLTYSLNNRWAIQPELLYSQKGVKYEQEVLGVPGVTFTNITNLTYLDIPILVKANIPMDGSFKPSVFLGPALGILLSAEQEIDFGGGKVAIDVKQFMSGIDFGLVFGAGATIPVAGGKVTFDIRYGLGLTTIDKQQAGETEAADTKNAVISVLVGYAF